MTFSNSFGIRCVGNAAFYASKNESAFLGCCTIDPGTTDDGLCPDDKLRPATFDPAAYSKIMAQECMGNDDTIMWYTCTSTSPPFLGCCSENPCAKGSCSPSALRAAKLSSNKMNASLFLGGALPAKPSAKPSTTTITTTMKTSVQASAATSATSATLTPSVSATAASGGSGHQRIHPATVAGIVIGTVAAIMAVAVTIFWWMRRRCEHTKENAFKVRSVSKITSDAPFTADSTLSRLYSAYYPHPSHSSTVSGYHPRPGSISAGNPAPINYHKALVATRTVDSVELPGSVYFKTPAQPPLAMGLSPRSPHNHQGFAAM